MNNPQAFGLCFLIFFAVVKSVMIPPLKKNIKKEKDKT
jgi:F0F1-type ATP synthase membrane subunit b/b'